MNTSLTNLFCSDVAGLIADLTIEGNHFLQKERFVEKYGNHSGFIATCIGSIEHLEYAYNHKKAQDLRDLAFFLIDMPDQPLNMITKHLNELEEKNWNYNEDDMDMLKYDEYKWISDTTLCVTAVRVNSVRCLQFLVKHGYKMTKTIFDEAVHSLACFIYLDRLNPDVKRFEHVCRIAAECGKLNMLKYAHGLGYRLERVVEHALMKGRVDCFKYGYNHGDVYFDYENDHHESMVDFVVETKDKEVARMAADMFYRICCDCMRRNANR